MSDMTKSEFADLAVAGDAQIGVSQGIAAIALSMAMKYHDISTVSDGALYQQYKLEGKNFETLSLAMVFETAKEIEAHLMASSDRIAGLIVEALTEPQAEDSQHD